MADFPSEEEPDGNRFRAHHYVQGAWVLALLAYHAHASWVLAFLALSLFGWYHLWHSAPQLGATSTLTGLAAALLASLVTPAFDLTLTVLAVVACLWAADDAIEHAFGIWTPLDWIWNEYLRDIIVSPFARLLQIV